MDSERALKIELRPALDEVLPPAPWLESPVREALRKRLSSRSGGPAHDQPRKVEPRMVWRRSAMQFAAALLVVVLAAAALAAVLDLRYRAAHVVPATMDVTAYQAMVSRDLDRLLSAGNGVDCVTLQSTCPASGTPVLNTYMRLAGDLDGSEPPDGCARIMRRLPRHV